MEARNLVDLFQESVRKYPDKPALIFYGRKITYKELDEFSDGFARLLTWLGIKKGDRVAFVALNTPNVPIAFLGAWKHGAVVAAVNPLEPSEKVVQMLKLADPRLIIVADVFPNHFEAINGDPNLGCLATPPIGFSIADYLPFLAKPVYYWKTRKTPKASFWFDWKYSQKYWDGDWRENNAGPSDLAVLQFTGGTTGVPKAAMLTHANLVSNTLQAIHHVNKYEKIIGSDSVFLGVMPFFHVYGLSVCLNMAFAVGGTVALLPKFDPAEVFRAIRKYKVNIFPSIPVMFAKLLEYGVKHFRYLDNAWKVCENLKLCFSGAGALDGYVKVHFERLTESTIIEGYGLSEASPIVSVNFVYGSKPGSLGTLVPDTEMQIADGELWIRGPQVMKGYWRNEEETAQAITEDGWLKTGDMVERDADGFLWLKDRKKDMVKVNGENVYTQKVEAAIRGMLQVKDVAVIGLPDIKTGERVVACVVPSSGDAALTLDFIRVHCLQRGLSSVEAPRELRLMEAIPKNIMGKILKNELKKRIISAPS